MSLSLLIHMQYRLKCNHVCYGFTVTSKWKTEKKLYCFALEVDVLSHKLVCYHLSFELQQGNNYESYKNTITI